LSTGVGGDDDDDTNTGADALDRFRMEN